MKSKEGNSHDKRMTRLLNSHKEKVGATCVLGSKNRKDLVTYLSAVETTKELLRNLRAKRKNSPIPEKKKRLVIRRKKE